MHPVITLEGKDSGQTEMHNSLDNKGMQPVIATEREGDAASAQKYENQRKRDFCVYEYHQEKSCPFERCMFEHHISEAQRRDLETRKRMAVKRETVVHRKKQMLEQPSREKEICKTAYSEGQGSCTLEDCPGEHELDYQRVRRGVCHYYILGRCTRKDSCFFCHQIPRSVKEHPETVKAAEEFIQSSRNKNTNSRVHVKSPLVSGSRMDESDNNAHPMPGPKATNDPKLMQQSQLLIPPFTNFSQFLPSNNTAPQKYPAQAEFNGQPQNSYIPYQTQHSTYDPFLYLMKHIIQNQSTMLHQQQLGVPRTIHQ